MNPVPHTSTQTFPAPAQRAGESSIFLAPRCTRARYVALAILLGPLGVHNFAAGYRFRGLVQLGLSVASLGLLSPVSAAWALVEAVVVRADGDGVAFSSARPRSHHGQPDESLAATDQGHASEPAIYRRAA